MVNFGNPMNDFAFKKLFGSEQHKSIPMDFLNAILELKNETKIIDLIFLETTQLPDMVAGKESIINVLVTDQAGTRYIIEMQVKKEDGFVKRAQYYVAKTYCENFKIKANYGELSNVVFISILNHTLFPKKQRCKTVHKILDVESLENDLQDFNFVFIEAQKFSKKESELVSIEDKWLYFFKNAKTISSVWQYFSKDIEAVSIKNAFSVLNTIMWNDNEKRVYENMLLNDLKAENTMIAAIKDALEEGKTEGKAEGLEEAKIKIAKEMLKQGINIEMISKSSGLSEIDLLKLKN